MIRELSTQLDELVLTRGDRVVTLPALVKGRLIHPRKVSFDELVAAAARAISGQGSATGQAERDSALLSFAIRDAHVIRQPMFQGSRRTETGDYQFIVLPRPDPRELIETDRMRLARGLFALPVSEVLAYVRELGKVLTSNSEMIANVATQTTAASLLDPATVRLLFDVLPTLFDADGLGASIDLELGSAQVPGRRFLDGWTDVRSQSHQGMMARARNQIFGRSEAEVGDAFRSYVRAVPTRQLHITAGNSLFVPVVSFLRSLATKGASVIKSPAEATAISAILAAGMRAVDADHPITRHTSLVYWPGGDRSVEDTLFAPDAFDRIVVWGSAETVRSVRARALHARTVVFNPRYSLSLIGRQAFPYDMSEAAIRASTDSMIGNQQACVSSLIHYVEADEDQALQYCRTLASALARWDEEMPHAVSRATLGKLRMLRRSQFLKGTWFENGTPPHVTSAVVYMPEPFDVAVHPMSRCVVVRRVDRLEEVLPLLSAAVSAVGIFPNEVLDAHRDAIAAAGVSNIFSLGDCERVYAGMPQDGMRVLSELVNWTSCGVGRGASPHEAIND